LPLMFLGFIMVLVGLFESSHMPRIIIKQKFRQATGAQKMNTADAQLQCPECNSWNSINDLYCKSCGTRLT
jgi:hypothetical protein